MKYKNLFVIILCFCVLALLYYLIPFANNDYVFYEEMISLRLKALTSFHSIGYIGNFISIILVKSNILKLIFIPLVWILISLFTSRIIDNNNKKMFIIILIFFFGINLDIFIRNIANITEFSNFTFPILFLSIYLFYIKKILNNNKLKIASKIFLCVIVMIMSLFNDYLSIYLVIISLVFNIYYFYKYKKLSILLLVFLILNVFGTIVLFNSTDVLFNSFHIFNYKMSNISIISVIARNYFNKIQMHLFFNNYIIVLIISILNILISIKYLKENKINYFKRFLVHLSSLVMIIYPLLIVLSLGFGFDVKVGIFHYIIGFILSLYLLCLFLSNMICLDKSSIRNKVLFVEFSIFVLIFIYSLSFNLNISSFIYVYYLIIIYILLLLLYVIKVYNIPPINIFYYFIIFFGIVISYIYIYYNANTEYKKMYDAFEKQIKNKLIDIYVLDNSYKKYILNYNSILGSNKNKFLKFYGFNTDVKLKIIDKNNVDYELLTKEKFKNNKLMIVAHPDDELIWGGNTLLNEDYVVVCVTCGVSKLRTDEFVSFMGESKDEYIILSFIDMENGVKSDWKNEKENISNALSKIINYKKWDKIVTHSPLGESGHIHHKMLSKIVTDISNKNKLYYFGKYTQENMNGYPGISDKEAKIKEKMFDKYYKSQKHVKFQRWFKYENIVKANNWKEVYLNK